MTIKMRLDTEGLRSLIAENPELEIEIGREVMNNIKLDNIEKAVKARIEEVLKSMTRNEGTWHNPRITITDVNFLNGIKAATDAAVNASIDESIRRKVAELVEHAVQVEREILRRNLKATLQELVTPEMARELMREKILL